MAPMQDNSPVSNGNARPNKGQTWKFVFLDPSFGGECPYVPHMEKRHSINLCSASPVLESLPAEVQEMLLGSPPSVPEKPPVAGSGRKAAEYLRRLSQDSGSGSESGLSDGSDDDAKKSDAGSGFSDMTAEDKEERKESKSVKYSSGGSAKSFAKEQSLKVDAAEPADDAELDMAPVRSNRRADTVLEKPEKRPSMSSDEDLLSNPFATDSEKEEEEDKGSCLSSKRSSAKSEAEISKKVAAPNASTEDNGSGVGSTQSSAKSENYISKTVAA